MKTQILAATLALSLCAACSQPESRRDFGTFVDDQGAEVRLIDRLYSRPEFGEGDHIKVEVHSGTLLLAGETRSAENKALAGELAAEAENVKRVVNELEVGPAAGSGGRFNNVYITSKINSKLTAANPLEGFDAARIKVVTANGTVYLMGTVTRAEADAVAEIARGTGGVDKVVKVFDYLD